MAQRLRLECYLEGHKKIATLKARSSEGKPHRVAEYVLMPGAKKALPEWGELHDSTRVV